MKKSVFTAIKIYENVALLQAEAKEIEMALISLRGEGPRWEANIREDKRLPVKLLYDQLITKRNELNSYESIEFVMATTLAGPPEDYRNW